MARMPEITIPVLPLPDDRKVAVEVKHDALTDYLNVQVSGSLLDEMDGAGDIWRLSHAIATALTIARKERRATG